MMNDVSVQSGAVHGGLGGPTVFGAAAIVVAAGGTAAVATHTSQTTPILAFGGAVIVAIIASLTAITNVRSSLNHERMLTDIQHLRELLDDAAKAYEQAFSGIFEMSASLEQDLKSPNRSQGIAEAFAEAFQGHVAFEVEAHRLEMRFPREHAVFSEYKIVGERLSERLKFLRSLSWDNEMLTGEAYDHDIRLGVTIRQAFSNFAAASRTEIGIREAQV